MAGKPPSREPDHLVEAGPLKYIFVSVFIAIATVAITAGCTARQVYNTGQGWQRNECNKLVDAAERERCMSSTNTSYEDYQRDVGKAKTP